MARCPPAGIRPSRRRVKVSRSGRLLQRITGQRIGTLTALHRQCQAFGPGAVEVALIADADVIEAFLRREFQRQATVEGIATRHGAQGRQAPGPTVVGQWQAKPDQPGQMRRWIVAQLGRRAGSVAADRPAIPGACRRVRWALRFPRSAHRRPRQQRHAIGRQRQIERFRSDAAPGLGPLPGLIRVEQAHDADRSPHAPATRCYRLWITTPAIRDCRATPAMR